MNLLKLVFGLMLLIPAVATAKPQVYLDYKTYYTPDNKPYIETLLQFVSPSLKFLANKNGDLVSSLEITQIFKIGDSVVFIDKYIELIYTYIHTYIEWRQAHEFEKSHNNNPSNPNNPNSPDVPRAHMSLAES